MKTWAGLLFITAVLQGCIKPAPPLPTVEWDTPEDVRQILIDRQNAIESVQTQLKLKITSPPPESETSTLDAALVIQGDDHFRLRAWKLNQTIFDLTATPDGTFIVANEEMKKRAPGAERELGKLTAQVGSLLRGPDYAEADFGFWHPDTPPELRNRMVATWPTGHATIDPRTLAPVSYLFITPDQSDANIQVETEFAEYDGLIWYRRLVAEGPFGKVEMTFRDVELNGELNPRAFKPSRRAVRVEDLETSENTSP